MKYYPGRYRTEEMSEDLVSRQQIVCGSGGWQLPAIESVSGSASECAA